MFGNALFQCGSSLTFKSRFFHYKINFILFNGLKRDGNKRGTQFTFKMLKNVHLKKPRR